MFPSITVEVDRATRARHVIEASVNAEQGKVTVTIPLCTPDEVVREVVRFSVPANDYMQAAREVRAGTVRPSIQFFGSRRDDDLTDADFKEFREVAAALLQRIEMMRASRQR